MVISDVAPMQLQEVRQYSQLPAACYGGVVFMIVVVDQA
jgi:hypothetical protein